MVEQLEDRALLTSIMEFPLPANSGPVTIVTGPDGALWFTNADNDSIGRISSGGTVTEFNISSGANPSGITVGPDGNLWFTEPGINKVGRITTSGTVTEFSLSSGIGPNQITSGADGNLWFTETDSVSIGRITTTGIFTNFATIMGLQPTGITSGPDGNLWFTMAGSNHVGMMIASGPNIGTSTLFTLSTGAEPTSITTGSDGNLWFTERGGNSIGRVTPGGTVTEFTIPTAASLPTQIVSGPGGDLYFTKAGTNSIGRVTTTGTFLDDVAAPTSNAGLSGITTGPGNHIWFTETTGNQIGRLNLGPVATPDTYGIPPLLGQSTVVPANIGVLANDSDPEADALTVTIETQAASGIVTLNTDGSFTYLPTGLPVADSFTYRVTDENGDSAITTVSLLVNFPPIAFNDSYLTDTNTPLVVLAATGVLANDIDAELNSLTATVVENPTHGTLTLNPDGSFTYTPELNYSGPDSFTYVVNDGKINGNSTATVSLLVTAPNVPPTGVADTYDGFENTPLVVVAPGVLANDTDPDSGLLIAMIGDQPSHGLLSLNPDGSFTYTPALDYSGPDSFTYTVFDGTDQSDPVTVTLNIQEVNFAPVANIDTYNATEDTPLIIAALGILANDTDVDGNPLTAVLVAGPSHGSLTLNPDGSFTYTPAANYNGPDSFTYKANDGTADSDEVTVTLNVAAVNDAPVAVPDSYTTYEDFPMPLSDTAGVLFNDTDADGDVLTAILVTSPTHGSITLNPNGSLTYIPDLNYHGPDSFTYKANDGTSDSNVVTVSLTVLPVDDDPVLIDGSSTLPQDSPFNGSVTPLSSDIDGDALTFLVIVQPLHGSLVLSPDGTFVYTPATGFSGSDFFTFQASDGEALSNVATYNLTVTDLFVLDLADGPGTIATSIKTQVPLDPTAQLTNVSPTAVFANASITAGVIAGGDRHDRIFILKGETEGGTIRVVGRRIYFNGTEVAKTTAGRRGFELEIQFNSVATEAAVNAVLQRISIKTTKRATREPRTVQIRVTAGGETSVATIGANVA